jgi:hypothetical protein
VPQRPSDTFSGVAPESIPAELLGMKYVADPRSRRRWGRI